MVRSMSATTKMTVEYFLNYVKDTKSQNTYKEYKNGIDKFSEWFGKTPDEILEMRRQDWTSGDLVRKKRFMRELEKFQQVASTIYPYNQRQA